MKSANRSSGRKVLPNTPHKPSAGRLVLVADDSAAQRRMIAIQLKRAGYRVVEAANAQDALQVCRDQQPQIVLSDWMMSGMTGPDFCREFRSLPREGYGYFILLTSKTDKQDIANGLKAGADDFLTKPLSGAELLARVNAGERILQFEEQLRAANLDLQRALDRLNEAQDAMERDLIEARKLQQGLFRERSGRFGAFDLSLLLRPAGHVGGDLVGFFPINEERVGIFAIDVSGHGVTAALLTAQLAAHLSGSTEQNVALRAAQVGVDAVEPIALARFFNNMLLEEMETDTYFTLIYAELDHSKGQIRMVQAGHPHPLLQRKGGQIERIGKGGMPVGVIEQPYFDEITLQMNPGDRLIIVSDGVTEASNQAGRLLGEDGLEAIMRTNAMLAGHSFLESMSWSISEYARGERSDDISAVLIEYREPVKVLPFCKTDGSGQT